MELIFSEDGNYYFPSQNNADEDGFLALGGDLAPERLLFAYKNGIFPWYDDNSPIAWWCTNPRFVLYPTELKVSKSMKQLFKNNKFDVTYNTCFKEVIENCSKTPRKDQDGTWIVEDIKNSYQKLFELGWIISVEVWNGTDLVGGLYGIKMGKIFFGESMFAKESNASKYGFISLVKKLEAEGIVLIDCQQETPHLGSLGAKPISRDLFLEILKENI
jgi:leucyl/phenylalanyl-tRNA--protein transferase